METAGFGDPPAFKAVSEPGRVARLNRWLANPWAERAVELYARAIEIAAPKWVGHLPDALFVALAPGGNTAHTGFTILDDTGAVAYPRVPYVELSEDTWRFGTTLLHESGGVGAAPAEMVVVGVVPSTRQLSLLAEPLPQFVRPLTPLPGVTFYVVARVRGSTKRVLPLLREAATAPGVEVTGVGTLRESLTTVLTPPMLRLYLVGCLAALALMLALLGVFGVVNHHVMCARREIGIRVVLGAAAQGETRRVVASALAPTA